ncbi:MAG TPA: hypothetical protein VL025_09225 [Thermoanaerobaculia bacterium]|nr:hypothetical protein [Thermoanaerobaculia bacterium]
MADREPLQPTHKDSGAQSPNEVKRGTLEANNPNRRAASDKSGIEKPERIEEKVEKGTSAGRPEEG